MKVFLSWSGSLSHRVACAFREWLPSVIQSVKPYVSSEDIDKGTRWSTDIAKELEVSSYGIICVTRDNLEAPWISFEAGSLSKIIDKSNVTPFLFNIKRSEVQGPLLQFQSAIYEKDDILKLLKSLNKRLDEELRLSDDHLKKSFEVWWPQLDKILTELKQHSKNFQEQPPEPAVDTSEILEEILELVRTQQRILSNPENLLPATYLDYVWRRSRYHQRSKSYPHDEIIIERLLKFTIEFDIILRSINIKADDLKQILLLVDQIHELIHELGGDTLLRNRRFSELQRRRGLLTLQDNLFSVDEDE